MFIVKYLKEVFLIDWYIVVLLIENLGERIDFKLFEL